MGCDHRRKGEEEMSFDQVDWDSVIRDNRQRIERWRNWKRRDHRHDPTDSPGLMIDNDDRTGRRREARKSREEWLRLEDSGRVSWIKDMTGARIGSLTVLAYAGRDRFGSVMWECECDCGAVVRVKGSILRQGRRTCCDGRKHRKMGGDHYHATRS